MAVQWLILHAGILCRINGFPSMSCLTLRSSMKAEPIKQLNGLGMPTKHLGGGHGETQLKKTLSIFSY